MKNFSEILEILDRLMGPQGCPWDAKQTFESLCESVMEEAAEVVEAVEEGDDPHLCEELGDLLFNVVFYCKIAEKEGRFTTVDVLDGLKEKLIRRHPHVFGDAVVETEEELLAQWNRIKEEEKKSRR
jgi:MazG family protein